MAISMFSSVFNWSSTSTRDARHICKTSKEALMSKSLQQEKDEQNYKTVWYVKIDTRYASRSMLCQNL